MLVLSRKKDESIHIGENVVVTVIEVRGDKVRLGIRAPRDVPVHRHEVYEAIFREAECERAAAPVTPAVAVADEESPVAPS